MIITMKKNAPKHEIDANAEKGRQDWPARPLVA